jgi:probable phosphoglycerate mutase
VRHGETAWNAEGRVQGQLDIPLNAHGEAQARAVAEALAGEHFDAIYASDLGRVRQTARPAAERLGLPVQWDTRLRERHYGIFQAITYAEAKKCFPEDYERFRARDAGYDFRTGESLEAFSGRCLSVVNFLVAKHENQQILIFTHGGVLEMVYREATASGLSTPRDFEIPNAALNRLEAGASGWRVTQWAEIGHLAVTLDDLPG